MDTSADPFNLARFVEAQQSGDIYAQAVAELRRGRKVSHWMWFVFPQIAGLGRSAIAQHYSLGSLAEARAYAGHDLLGPRLVQCSTIITAHADRSAKHIFGDIDALKLRSSMTLFLRAVPAQPVFRDVLDVFFASVPDAATDEQLALRHRLP